MAARVVAGRGMYWAEGGQGGDGDDGESASGSNIGCILIAHFTGDGGNEYFGREP